MLEVEELKRRLDNGEELLVLDGRTPDDFIGQQGHLEVARNLPLENLSDHLDELGQAPERTIAIICRTDHRSGEAAALLAQRGFGDVDVVRGGMTAWLEHGRSSAVLRKGSLCNQDTADIERSALWH